MCACVTAGGVWSYVLGPLPGSLGLVPASNVEGAGPGPAPSWPRRFLTAAV